jgi:Domain of unknown function (DUF4159)/Aerotolerance regulator N-terminal
MMGFLQSLSFVLPMALIALAALPLIWWLLRFTPPKPRPEAFPPIRILLGLKPDEETPDKTPWWLLLLRLALASLVIFVVAQPFLKPLGTEGLPSGNRLIIVDDGFAAAQRWSERRTSLLETLETARRAEERVTLLTTAPRTIAVDYTPVAAAAAMDQARVLKPQPLLTDRLKSLDKISPQIWGEVKSIVWLADGIERGEAEDFTEALAKRAPQAAIKILAPTVAELPLALGTPELKDGEINVPVIVPPGAATAGLALQVKATNGRTLLDVPVTNVGNGTAFARFALPTTLRNEVQSIALSGQNHAGARSLFDDRWRRRTIALQTAESTELAQPLLSPLHYVSRGLEPYAELFTPQTSGDIGNLIDAGLSMLVLADVSAVAEDIAPKVGDWIEKGGVLLRFAGPRLAAGHDEFIPVKLREGDRTLGSSLSWETPQTMQPFPDQSPFAGLTVDPRITVSRQVLAEPDGDLASRTWASLADGTPLVTAERRGKGLIVLFHVTANANWSNLPLSGLFVDMMQRVAGLDPSQVNIASDSAEAQNFTARLVLNGEGDLVSPDGTTQAIAVKDFDTVKASAIHPPGLYVQAGRERAVNLGLTTNDLRVMPTTLAGQSVSTYAPEPTRSLVPEIIIAAVILFLLDCLATLSLGGGMARLRGAAAVFTLALLFQPFDHALAQDAAMEAALSPRLAYVKTGNAELDQTSAEGLEGLTLILSERTSASLAKPVGLDIGKDDLALYPLLYWPVDDAATALDDASRQRIASFMKNGGTIFFDLRNGDLATGSAASDALRRILDKLDVPPLEPVPDNHVLTRAFYLLDRFPGRYESGPLWVESTLGDPSSDPGTADGVSSLIIGSNDYAAAWAIDEKGEPRYAVVPGSDRQREFAFRTGINVVMYALTGNYKADQVHVPALLERLGQ